MKKLITILLATLMILLVLPLESLKASGITINIYTESDWEAITDEGVILLEDGDTLNIMENVSPPEDTVIRIADDATVLVWDQWGGVHDNLRFEVGTNATLEVVDLYLSYSGYQHLIFLNEGAELVVSSFCQLETKNYSWGLLVCLDGSSVTVPTGVDCKIITDSGGNIYTEGSVDFNINGKLNISTDNYWSNIAPFCGLEQTTINKYGSGALNVDNIWCETLNVYEGFININKQLDAAAYWAPNGKITIAKFAVLNIEGDYYGIYGHDLEIVCNGNMNVGSSNYAVAANSLKASGQGEIEFKGPGSAMYLYTEAAKVGNNITLRFTSPADRNCSYWFGAVDYDQNYRWKITDGTFSQGCDVMSEYICVHFDSGASSTTIQREVNTGAPKIITPDQTYFVSGIGGSYRLAATGDAPIIWSLDGNQPAGVTIGDGYLEVAATVAPATYTFTIAAANASGPTDYQVFTLYVTQGYPPTIFSGNSLSIPYGTDYGWSVNVNGTWPMTFSLGTDAPSGVTINNNGYLYFDYGIPLGTYTFTIRVSNTFGYDEQRFTLNVVNNPGLTPVTINIANLNTDANNSANYSNQSQWVYYGGLKMLVLNTAYGNYILTGTNSDINVTSAQRNINLTLNNVNIETHVDDPSLSVSGDNTVITLTGNNSLKTYANRHSFDAVGCRNLTFSSNTAGKLVVDFMALNGNNSRITFQGNAEITAGGRSTFNYPIWVSGAGNYEFLIGDNAKLNLLSKGTYSYTFTKASSANTHKWKVNNGEITSGDEKSATITVKLPNTTTFTTTTISRVALPSYTSKTFTFNTITGYEYYQVYRSTKKTTGFALVGTTTTTSFTDYHLKPGTTYYYKVRAVKVVNKKNVYSAYLPTLAVATTTLPLVGDVKVKTSARGLAFEWTNDHEMKAVQVYYATTNTSRTKWSIASFDGSDFILDKLLDNKLYYYKLRYVYYDGLTAYSAFTPVKSITTSTIDRTINPVVIDAYTNKTIEYDAIADYEYYQIYRSTKKTIGFKLVGTTTATKFTDYYLAPGTTYYYKVRAVKVVNKKNVYSAYSPLITTSTTKLPIPNDVTVTGETGSLKVKWDNNHDMLAIQVYYATTNTSRTKWAVMTVSAEEFKIMKLPANKKYFYKTRYVYYNGNISYSAFSTVKDVTTK